MEVFKKYILMWVDSLNVNLYKNQTFTLFTVIFFFIDDKTEEILAIKKFIYSIKTKTTIPVSNLYKKKINKQNEIRFTRYKCSNHT